MSDISLKQIKELRKRTGVGIQNVKEALEESDGDIEKAVVYLRKKGIAKAAKRAGKAAENGFIAHYIHGGGQIGVLVELNSETDFAARNERFQELAHDIAMHIAANNPEYISIEDIPEEELDKEKKVYAKDLEGKPENVKEKILEGKLSKHYQEVVLLEQPFLKDDSKKVKDLLNEAVAAIGEKVEIGRYARFEISAPANGCGLES
ncbi:translation elongation factor Ts [Candidatus Dojkabacteria bacterium]|nr:translation elongation factor Ts [Candidatus Dojkabacteria bacterium]